MSAGVHVRQPAETMPLVHRSVCKSRSSRELEQMDNRPSWPVCSRQFGKRTRLVGSGACSKHGLSYHMMALITLGCGEWRIGHRSFYSGFGATCLLDVAYAAAQFFAMEKVTADSGQPIPP